MRVGIDRPADPRRVARLERARATVDDAARAELERSGAALSHADALGLVAQMLWAAGEGGVGPPRP